MSLSQKEVQVMVGSTANTRGYTGKGLRYAGLEPRGDKLILKAYRGGTLVKKEVTWEVAMTVLNARTQGKADLL
jgi:hypothetical protein